MKWLFLIVGGLFEIGWAIGLKYTEGFTKLVPSILTIIGLGLSVYFLSLAIKDLPLGVAYAIWTGIGTLGTVIVSTVLFKESLSIAQVLCIVVIIFGIVGLKFLTSK